ncbi:unnamed protein product, partial [Meganyctiphanes norvegica]
IKIDKHLFAQLKMIFNIPIGVPVLLLCLLALLAVHSATASHILLNDTQECGFRNILVFNFSSNDVLNNTASFTVHSAEGSLMLHIFFKGMDHQLYNDTLNITHTASQLIYARNGSYHTESLNTSLPSKPWTTVTISTDESRRSLVLDEGIANFITHLTLDYPLDAIVVSGSNMSRCIDDGALWEACASSYYPLGWVILGIVVLICIGSAISVAYDVIMKKKKMPFKPKFRPPEAPKSIGKNGLKRSESRRGLFIIGNELDSTL